MCLQRSPSPHPAIATVRQNPAYEALSYAWGSNDDPCSVQMGPGFSSDIHEISQSPELQGCQKDIERDSQDQLTYEVNSPATIPTTRNLDSALRHLRYQAKERVMWIDALCIDQFSTHEKNRQVAAMGHIFSAADRVIIWLGPEEN
jgi:hypothetical protein